jgi:glycine hydroxymethyltransferase
MADIAHTAGLVIAGVVPSPVGSRTSLPSRRGRRWPLRGAVMITHKPDLAKKLDKGVSLASRAAHT